jgi:hypothetical protein
VPISFSNYPFDTALRRRFTHLTSLASLGLQCVFGLKIGQGHRV